MRGSGCRRLYNGLPYALLFDRFDKGCVRAKGTGGGVVRAESLLRPPGLPGRYAAGVSAARASSRRVFVERGLRLAGRALRSRALGKSLFFLPVGT